jgi:single-stranded DNA-binding protein
MTIECAFFGGLGRNAEAKTSKGGKAYLRLNVRVGDGDTGQWITATVFDTEAIEVAAMMVKGARVYLEGSLTLNEWVGADGVKRGGLSVMSFHCRLSQIGRSKVRRDQQKQDDPAPPPPSGRERAARSDFAPAGKAPAFDDDIPFAPEFR